MTVLVISMDLKFFTQNLFIYCTEISIVQNNMKIRDSSLAVAFLDLQKNLEGFCSIL